MLRLFVVTIFLISPFLVNQVGAEENPTVKEKIQITYIFSDGNIPGTNRAFKNLLDERPELRDLVDITFLTESSYSDLNSEKIFQTDTLVFDMMNQQLLERFNQDQQTDLIAEVVNHGEVLAVGIGLLPKEHYLDQGARWDEKAMAYWQLSGPQNQLALLKYALTLANIKDLDLPEPVPALDFGYYYPDGETGRVFPNWDEFLQFQNRGRQYPESAPVVAIPFYRASYYTGQMDAINAVIEAVENQGGRPVPLFGYPGSVAVQQLLIDEQGTPRADVALSFLFRFADFSASQALVDANLPTINMMSLYGRTEREWRESATGLSIFEGSYQVATPELAGLIAPIVTNSQEKFYDIDTGLSVVASKPIPERITLAVERALAFARLKQRPNSEKHIALMFYNYPPSKANIGASYLNVAETLAALLNRLRLEGYNVGEQVFSAEELLAELTSHVHNVAGYAEGELAEVANNKNNIRISATQYTQWLDNYSAKLRDKILADWGAVQQLDFMAVRGDRNDSGTATTNIIVPALQFGNVVVLPQPARGWGEDLEKLYHAKDLAPHHQYVATYEWLKQEFNADAVVHIGTHGTLEWLDGKDLGQTRDDASDALIGALPNFNIYNVDVIGEGLVAKRRGMATLVDHMVPPFTQGELYGDLAALNETINNYHINHHKNPEVAKIYEADIIRQLNDLGIAKDMGLDLSVGHLDHDFLHDAEDYLIELKKQYIPYGLHTFGRAPAAEYRRSTAAAVATTDRSLLPEKIKILSTEMENRILTSATRELDNLILGLNGGFIPVGSGGEPIRNPNAYPTGKNFYGVDPEKIPKKASWQLGSNLAQELLDEHLATHGRYPEKLSFVIWGNETLRHEGVLESQIIYLLGAQPVWDERDKVVDIDIIPKAQLNRPRVDIVIASAAEGMFGELTRLIDKTIQQVKLLDEADNYIRAHYLNTRSALIERGYSEQEAERRAGVRIFDEPPGIYNLNTSNITAASGSWNTEIGMAHDYITKMGHGYGNGFWGEPMEDVFRLNLAGVEKVVHSSSTMLYGALDNDDFFMYAGGLATAIRSTGDTNPDIVVTNTRDPGKPEMTDMVEFIGKEFRSRYINPKWIEGMQAEGYAGAVEMRNYVEYLWGWDATMPQLVDDAMWTETFAVYVEDKHNLQLKEYFAKNSPYAYQDMTARMLETVRKGYWQADTNTVRTLLEEYIESVNTQGVGCAEHTCGNPRFLSYVLSEAQNRSIPLVEIEKFQQAMETMINGDIPSLAAAAEQFAQTNEQRIAEREIPMQNTTPAEESSGEQSGFLMEPINQEQSTPTTALDNTESPNLLPWVLAVVLFGVLLWWRYRFGIARRSENSF